MLRKKRTENSRHDLFSLLIDNLNHADRTVAGGFFVFMKNALVNLQLPNAVSDLLCPDQIYLVVLCHFPEILCENRAAAYANAVIPVVDYFVFGHSAVKALIDYKTYALAYQA